MNKGENLSSWLPWYISKRTAQSSPSPELLGSPSAQAVYLDNFFVNEILWEFFPTWGGLPNFQNFCKSTK